MRVLSFQIFFTVIFLGALLGRQFSAEDELLEFEASLKSVQAFAKADNERLLKVKKVTGIIDNFNPKMATVWPRPTPFPGRRLSVAIGRRDCL